MFKPIESYRQTYLALDAYGIPVAVLKQAEGTTQDEVNKFRQLHAPNAVELKNFAEFLEEHFEKAETQRRIAEMTKVRRRRGILGFNFIEEQQYSLYDAKVKIVNEVLDGLIRVKAKFVVQPRKPQPKPEPGERGRALAEADQKAAKAANAYPPKLAALMEKRRKLDAEIGAALDEIRLAKIAEEAKRRKRNTKDEKGPGFVDRWRQVLAAQESLNPRKQAAIEAGIIKG